MGTTQMYIDEKTEKRYNICVIDFCSLPLEKSIEQSGSVMTDS